MERRISQTGSVDPRIQLRGSAAFQLLLFAAVTGVRDAAARALEPCIRIDEDEMKCHDRDFASLPFAERIAARIVASMYAESLARKGLFGAVPHRNFELMPPCPTGDPTRRVFRLVGGPNRSWVNGARTGKRHYRIQDTFVLPSNPEQLLMAHVRSIQRRGAWSLDGGGPAHVRFQRSRELGRATSGWEVPRLVGPDGRVECLLPMMSRNPLRASIEIDSGFLLRLAAGQLEGCVISFRRECAHGARAIEASIEIGDLDGRPPLLFGCSGTFASTLDIEARLGVGQVDLPAIGGATVDCLDSIARCVGVRHGDSLRGSFAYHPLASAQLRASARTATKEVA